MNFLESIYLPQNKIDDIIKYEKSFGQRWVDRALLSAKAQQYIDENLTIVGRDEGVSGRCMSSGTIVFERKDGNSITDDDVSAILVIERGQVNRIAKRTDRSATVYWLCDSSD
jgi:hypothetical protein